MNHTAASFLTINPKHPNHFLLYKNGKNHFKEFAFLLNFITNMVKIAKKCKTNLKKGIKKSRKSF